ncbi:tripartite-type tricarboxylate transporter receptor subunit TctC [Pseudacidovorax intermedius]|uniref:Tripartite-type tricarboxylate transporter receptor subunit TctC n=1 Tax=Pseudacidovorax intermedius TaxID=433924 RepID=A0A370FN95_9BURK|nr:tripartite tricarboxylate transporter substrate binding protein [Pseudacidovorax intermedius]RDI28733.1 tripartite-type tricarboxylate transporter receptor subunit TctC [Pseudacidovorax intermedius]
MARPRLPFARRPLLQAALALAAALALSPALAQDNQTVRLVVGYAAGGPVDQGARLVAVALSRELGAPVLVENKPGANATLAGGEVVRAKPDGLTLFFAASPTITISPNVMARMPFDPARDLTPVAPVLSYYNVLVANNDEPFRTTRELVTYAKAHPGKLSYGSAGVGGSNHLGVLLFAKRSGIALNHIPYKGNAPAMTDLIGGQIDMMMDIISTAGTYIAAGKVRPIAVTSPQRNATLPDVPTLAESGIAGLEGFDVGGWYGIYGPKDLPAAKVDSLNRAITATLAQPALARRLKELGYDEWTGSPQKLAERAAQERAMWSTVTQGIVVD